jgi:hypothetical protein
MLQSAGKYCSDHSSTVRVMNHCFLRSRSAAIATTAACIMFSSGSEDAVLAASIGRLGEVPGGEVSTSRLWKSR